MELQETESVKAACDDLRAIQVPLERLAIFRSDA